MQSYKSAGVNRVSSYKDRCKTRSSHNCTTISGGGCRCVNFRVNFWQLPLVATALVIIVLTQSVSSSPTPPPFNNELPDIQLSHDFNQSGQANAVYSDVGLNNETSAFGVREFAAGIATSDGFNITDDLQDQHDPKRVDFLRERNRQQRIVNIQKTILEKLGLFQSPNITSPYHVSDDYRKRMERVFHLLQSQPQNVQSTESEDIYAKRVQSFYPSCSLPRNMDREVWSDSGLFHIYYEVPIPQMMEGTSMTVSSAKLRLYKITPMPDNSVTSTLSSTFSVTNSPASNRLEKSTGDTGSLSCDERIRITVFQYTKPIKKAKKVLKRKRKLIDSRMVPADFEGWLEFDVRSSARDWLENSSRNLGLEIELEDSMTNTRNPSEYLRNMNCSEANDPPFPRFMEDRMKGPVSDEDTMALFENETYPTLDLKTIEVEDPVDVVPKSNHNTSRQPNVVRLLTKRHVITHSCGDNNEANYTHGDGVEGYDEANSCCNKFTYVSFADLDVGDKIVEPAGFYTKTCVGRCTPVKGEEYICAPKLRAGVNVKMLDENNKASQVTLPDLVTKSCSCQPKSSIQQSYDY